MFAWVAILIKRRITPPLVEPLFSRNFPHFLSAETRMKELTRLQASSRGYRGHLKKLLKKSEENLAHRNDMTDLILASAKSTRDQLRGGHGVYGIAVLSFSSSGISVILILMCGIAVSFSTAVCGFWSFWLTVFGKRRSFTVLRYRSFGLSCLM